MVKDYCTQNNSDCSICSLVSYGRDCQNKLLWGGKREGAGRKSTGRKKRTIYVTDEEHIKAKEFIESIRGDKAIAALLGSLSQ